MAILKFLIIDDEVVDRAYYQRMLKNLFHQPYEAIEAASGSDAIKKLKNNVVDFILLDYQLPDTTGVELLKKIKKTVGKFVPVIMLTGRGDEETAVAAIKMGASNFMIKNKIDPDVLIHTITQELRNAQLNKTIYDQKKKLKQYAYYDNLTGLMNRHTFEEMAERALIEAKEFIYALAIIQIDLDNFMAINDTLGHLAGNEVLVEIANRLKKVLVKDTVVARLGGDEFAVLLTGSEKEIEDFAATTAKKVIEELGLPYQLTGKTGQISASVGIACYPASGGNLIDLLRNSNIAMMRSKEKGKGTLSFYARDIGGDYLANKEIEQALHNAIAVNNEFVLGCQPRFELKTKKIVGGEVLLCWQKSQNELISPDQFMSVALRFGLVVPLGIWGIQSICQHFKDNFKDLRLSIAMNLMPKHLEELKKCAVIGAGQIDLEVGESSIMDFVLHKEILQALQGLSIQLRITDFKIGIRSIDTIMQLPIRTIKLDSSLIKMIGTGQYHNKMIKMVIQIAKELGLSTVAEGVETEAQLNYLLEAGCIAGQGNYLCGVLSLEEFQKFILNYKP